MKTTLLLYDETRPAKLALHNVAPTKLTVRQTEAIAGAIRV
jgi:hypothetical protein